MNRLVTFILIVLLISIVACKQAKQPQDVMEKPKTTDAAVDAVGKDLNNVNSVENDLNIDELNDLDSGLVDIDNI